MPKKHLLQRLFHFIADGLIFSVATWRNGNALISIDKVTLRRARLVLGWVTVFGQAYPPRYVASHLGQLSLLPSAGREMSTGQGSDDLRFGNAGKMGDGAQPHSIRE